MNHLEFAGKLIEANNDERSLLFKQHSEFCNVELAESLRQICYEAWTKEPQKVAEIALTLRDLANLTGDFEIKAHSQWAEAIRKLVGGLIEEGVFWFECAEKTFLEIGKFHSAATTQTGKLYALALLGRYDEAVNSGLQAREIFLAHGDIYSVGKIEHNIGNLFWRRDLYRESEPFLESALKRFAEVDDQRQLAMVENCKAFVKALQNNFREAETIYKQALNRAKENDLTVTEAEIEIGMSNLYLFQGKYDLALKFMESSRSKYDLLGMPHQSAICELEIADIYLELNLLPEAIEFYEKAEAKFIEIEMQAELGRSFLNHAKALFLLYETELAGEILRKAEEIFQREGNEILAASVKFAKSQIFYRKQNYEAAELYAENALEKFISGENLRSELLVRWFLGEILTARNERQKAAKILSETKELAAAHFPQIEYLCLVSLGKLNGNEENFLDAIEIVENTNSMLSGDEFRMAFLSAKMLPYNELVKIKLAQKDFSEALKWHERARARTLFEEISSSETASENSKLKELREELNWFYSRMNRQTASGLEARQEISELRQSAILCEKEFTELLRRLQITKKTAFGKTQNFVAPKSEEIPADTTVIEFIVLDGKISAFVLNPNNLEFYKDFADEKMLDAEINRFLFQIKTARFQEKLSPENRRIAFERLLGHAQRIYESLLRPLEKSFFAKRLTIIPSSFLYYLPFQALHTGENFLIKSKEISYAPSLKILQSCLNQKSAKPKNALLMGITDKITPLVKTEVENLSKLFEHSVKLVDENATLKNLAENVENADVLHLACHGIFRPDNPNFSALSLFEENLTARDAQNLSLRNKFITLSACKTGLNKIVPGEELIGLTRGFLAAGASSLVLSLWTVNDESTLKLMEFFYKEFQSGKNPSKALQIAQNKLLEENSHPYFWSAFVLIGHW